MALSKVDLANQVENQLPQGLVANNLPFRNIIINGDMSIAQRATSTSSITGDGYHTVDRFKTLISSAGTWTQSQSTDVPSGQGFAKSLKMDCTTADASLSAADAVRFQQLFEGQNLQYLKKGTSSAESLTLSFWVKSNKTGTYAIYLYDQDNARSISKTYTISSASTWEKKTITFAGDTTGAFDNDNALSLQLNFVLAAGTNWTSGTLNTSWNSWTQANSAVGQVNLADDTANEWFITGVQLEAGTTASDFEFLPYDVNIQRCYRYFELSSSGSGKLIGIAGCYETGSIGASPSQTLKRTTPSLYQTSGSNYYGAYRAGSYTYASSLNIANASPQNSNIYIGGGTTDQVFYFLTTNASSLFAFDAEL